MKRSVFATAIAAVFLASAASASDNASPFDNPGTYYFSKEGGMSFHECSRFITFTATMANLLVEKPSPTVQELYHLEFDVCFDTRMLKLRCVGASTRVELINQDQKCTSPETKSLQQEIDEIERLWKLDKQ